MKANQRVLIIITFLLSIYGATLHAAVIYGESISVTPTTPDINDFLIANITGAYASTGYIFDSAQLDNIINNTINIDLFIDAPNGTVLTVITDFSYFVNLGLLNSGIYSISADFYFDGNLENTVTDSFSVTSVPVPAGIWLFFSGILSIFSFGWLNKNPHK